MCLCRRWWRQRVVKVEEVAGLVHDADVVFEDLPQRGRAVAGHATLEAVEARELVRELRIEEQVPRRVFVLPFIVLVAAAVNDVRARSHVSCAVVEVQAVVRSGERPAPAPALVLEYPPEH